jgi:malic enzyme
MVKFGCSITEARKLIHLVDNKGLLTAKRTKAPFRLLPGQENYLFHDETSEGLTILETIKLSKPSILLGLSGVGGLFTGFNYLVNLFIFHLFY